MRHGLKQPRDALMISAAVDRLPFNQAPLCLDQYLSLSVVLCEAAQRIDRFDEVVCRHLDFDAVTFNTIDKGGYSRFDLATSYTLPWTAPLVKQVS